jgi:hypothetical protein
MNYYFTIAAILLGYMTLWFILSVIKKRNDIADIAWGLGFVLIAWFSLYLSEYSLKAFLVNCLVQSGDYGSPGIYITEIKTDLKIQDTWNGEKLGNYFI